MIPNSGVVVAGDENRFCADGAADLLEIGEHFFGSRTEGICTFFKGIAIEDDSIGTFEDRAQLLRLINDTGGVTEMEIGEDADVAEV